MVLKLPRFENSAYSEIQSFFYGGHFLWILFRASLQKFGLKFLAPLKFCLLLHLCFSYMSFIDETDIDCKLSVSKGSVNVLSTSKMKTIFLLTLDFAAETTRCRGTISRIGSQLTLNEVATMHRSDCDYLDQAFFRRKVNMKSLMKTVTLHMIVIKPLQCSFNRNK